MNKTGLYQAHLDAGAKMVDFGGWQMPINYGSQIEEHHAVRQECGMFDVSHMTVIDVKGKDATTFLYRLLAGDITKTNTNQALYSTMLNEQGGVIDDLIVYKLADDNYRIISNAATRDKDMAWISKQSSDFDVNIKEQTDLAIIAVQGPEAEQQLQPLLNIDLSSLKKFYADQDQSYFIGRTGYTGEDGFEVVLPVTDAPVFWQKLLDTGVKPCGLGARDTLRLEAGMHLYGQDMDEGISPINCGLAWSVRKKDHDFIGGDIIAKQRQQGSETKLVGLVLDGRGILRHGQIISDDNNDIGIITSGGYSPTTEQAIAFARIPKNNQDKQLYVSIRNKKLPCRVVKLPFVRNGQSLLEE
ncbi:glycine cleavage system aminomethyltransferase GcvT [Marinicella gelatinilytica]|uniref:glycine cleavage system aminomethyltransferase GcvT n=1 Tax=Marinicella gelatinilytica TaxID=2996017 RepID=UPI002260AA86|nr:glycine cleavage system aminomethyltransferase GcvT [Marinicella gelatinilytica]MCX7543997.1 glycine cleavage system aminomethyltransferase GcvT [Marinicella gelatinilytica]